MSIAEEQASRSDESSAEIVHRLRTRISIILARAWRKSLKKRARGEDSAGVEGEGPSGGRTRWTRGFRFAPGGQVRRCDG